MTETLPAVQDNGAYTLTRDESAVLERVMIEGDLSQLSGEERVSYYFGLCKSLRLNPLTRPFAYLNLSGGLTLYARKDCAEQLRRIHNVSITDLKGSIEGDLYVVTATGRMPNGRVDMDQGAVTIAGLRGEALVNARLKATTKAKRRVTLSLCGLGIMDETEIETVPGARPVHVDEATGEILEPRAALAPAPGGNAEVTRVTSPPGGRPAAPPRSAPSPAAQARLEYGKTAHRAGQLGIKVPPLVAQMTAEEIGEQREMLEGMIRETEAKAQEGAAA